MIQYGDKDIESLTSEKVSHHDELFHTEISPDNESYDKEIVGEELISLQNENI